MDFSTEPELGRQLDWMAEFVCAEVWPRRQADGAELDRRLGGADAGVAAACATAGGGLVMTLHAAWKIDREGAAAAREEIALIKFYGAGVLHDVVDRFADLLEAVTSND